MPVCSVERQGFSVVDLHRGVERLLGELTLDFVCVGSLLLYLRHTIKVFKQQPAISHSICSCCHAVSKRARVKFLWCVALQPRRHASSACNTRSSLSYHRRPNSVHSLIFTPRNTMKTKGTGAPIKVLREQHDACGLQRRGSDSRLQQ